MSKLKLIWKRIYDSYDSYESFLVLLGGAMVHFLQGNNLAALTFFNFAVLVRVPALVRWLKMELKTEEEIENIRSSAYSLSLDFKGEVYVVYKDRDNKILLKERVQNNMLKAVQASMDAAVILKDDGSEKS